jgi:hypothetical protein
MSPSAQIMKTGRDALDTAENMSMSANHENGTHALVTAENENERSKHKNGT